VPVTLIAKYRVRPGHADAVRKLLVQMADRVEADEPACLLYQANQSTDNGDIFCLYEVYTDEPALLAHRETEHFKEIVEAQIVPLLDSREREVYTQVVG
jgi:(4S)-4-hydroxy-5-phosphonooxypentane-2,3-dione isomerase